MKKNILVIAIASLFSNCQNELCDSGSGDAQSVSEMGVIVFHTSINRLVIRSQVPGTIDSFHTFIPCNLSANDVNGQVIEEGKKVQFGGRRQFLNERSRPVAMIAGEEFFVIVLNEIRIENISN